MMREHVFEVDSGCDTYPLPEDYWGMPTGTEWNQSEQQRAVGPVPIHIWQELKSGLITTGIYDSWRMTVSKGLRKFTIDPVPTTGEDFVFNYISTHWIADQRDQPR